MTRPPPRRPTQGLREGEERSLPPHHHHCSSLPLLLLLLLLSSSSPVAGQEDVPDDDASDVAECSYCPREYTFRLYLSSPCPALPPPFPPNDVFGAGVRDYTCNVGPEPKPKSSLSSVEGEGGGGGGGRGRGRNNRELQTTNITDYFPEYSVDDLEWSSQEYSASQIEEASMTPTLDTVPVAVYSIQFLEVDPDFNVINQDSSYVRDIDFVDGTVFTYASIIETSTTIPGGMNRVLRGVNAAGDPVRNVFTITYTNDCGVPTFEVGDSIGWVIFVSPPPLLLSPLCWFLYFIFR